MNYRIILYTLGCVLNIEAIAMCLPLICALIYGEAQVWAFLISICICLAFGLPLTIWNSKNKAMYAREGFTAVALSWIVMSIFGSLPFVISGSIPNFINALFETVSGFTTTGASILSDVEILPKSIIFWRSFTHWIGGMGVLVFIVAVLPLSGGSNMYLVKAESPGPSVSKLVPKVKSTAKILYGIYIFLTIAEIVLLLLGGMSIFDSLTLSFGTAGTGGFGILNSGAETYTPYIQWIITIFMILFGIDFSVYYLILVRNFKAAFRSDEVKAYLGIILLSVILITLNCRGLFDTITDAIRNVAFTVSSIITTTGYATVDFDKWNEFSKAILFGLMFIGACAGSTGGGMKVSRIIILLKSIVKEIKIAAHPRSTHKLTMNGRLIEHETVRAVNVYFVSFFVIYAASFFIVSLNNYDFTTNFTAVAATINNIGPGFKMVGPTQNFGFFNPLSKIVFIMDMLIGRLEIFPMLVLFSRYTWKR